RRGRGGVVVGLVAFNRFGFRGLVDFGGLLDLVLVAVGVLRVAGLLLGLVLDLVLRLVLRGGGAGAHAARAQGLFGVEGRSTLRAGRRPPAQVVELGLAVRADLFGAEFRIGQGR